MKQTLIDKSLFQTNYAHWVNFQSESTGQGLVLFTSFQIMLNKNNFEVSTTHCEFPNVTTDMNLC